PPAARDPAWTGPPGRRWARRVTSPPSCCPLLGPSQRGHHGLEEVCAQLVTTPGERHGWGPLFLDARVRAQRDVFERNEFELRIAMPERELQGIESRPRLAAIKDQRTPALAQDDMNQGDVGDLLRRR